MVASPNDSASSRTRRSLVWIWLARALLSVGVFGLTLSIVGWAGRYRFNVSGSLPIGLYRVVAPSLTRGSLVLGCLPRSVSRLARARGYVRRGSCPGGVEPIGKRVLAVAGDTVDVTANGLVLDGRFTPGSKPLAHDTRERTLLHVGRGRYVVRGGTIWLFSNHSAQSDDSRYFGPLEIGAVVGGLIPVAWPAEILNSHPANAPR